MTFTFIAQKVDGLLGNRFRVVEGNQHTPSEMGIDDFQANRSPDKRYRTTPLGGLFTRAKGGFYHDGRFQTLLDVVNSYNSRFTLGLTSQESLDLVEYLKSL